MLRLASTIGLPEENRLEYERLHANAWPGVLAALAASNIRNYSIFRHGELLFSYMEYVGDDYEADLRLLSEDPVTRAWLRLCGPLQLPLEDRRDDEWWKSLPEIFHMD
ncbi:L-rhamnose mutarotase [Leifsonia sp. NPDC077715]|uniref:L-rhamnose mutarotase n=1 Tax=Leifsonia sp. NPDC077715 TaxID=3155539 RepID=UPI00343DB54C